MYRKTPIQSIYFLLLLQFSLFNCVQTPLDPPTADQEEWDSTQFLLKEQGCDSAIPSLKNFLGNHPGSIYTDNAKLDLAACQASSGLPEAAVQTYRSVSTRSASYSKAQLKVGEVMLEDSRIYPLDSAIQQLELFVKYLPNDPLIPEALYDLAKVYYRRATSGTLIDSKDYNTAAQYYQQIVSDYPNHSRSQNASYRLAWCFYQQLNYQKAALAFEFYAQTYPHDPALDDALYWWAKSLDNNQQPCEAKAIWNRILNEHPWSDKTATVKKEVLENVCES